jgi:hypothetical protein
MEHKGYQENADQHFVDVLANRETNPELSETLIFVSMSSL